LKRAFQQVLFVLLCAITAMSCGSSSVNVAKTAAPELPNPRVPFIPSPPFSTWVDTTLASMTLEEKVGQVMMARTFGHYISTDSDEFEELARLVQERKIGGLALFQGDVYASAILLNKLQRLAKVPLLVAGDFERGVAMRVRRGTYFPDAMAIGATRNLDYAYKAGRAIGEEARAIGVHQNFAPVADINNNPDNPVINTRSFGEDPFLVAQMVEAFVGGTNDGGVVSTAKHFPGHGDTGMDSHLALPVMPFDRARLDSVELVSFRRAIESGVISVMIAHLEVPALDSTAGRPATLSSDAVSGLLKSELGFKGIIITDAMEMRGLRSGYSIAESSVLAFKAGADILLLPADVVVAAQALTRAVLRGEIADERLDESVRKILMVKYWLHLDEERFVDIDRISQRVGTKENRRLAAEIARNAITVVRNEGGMVPLRVSGGGRLVSIIISDTDDNLIVVHRPNSRFTDQPVGQYFTRQLRQRYGWVDTHRLTPSSNRLDCDSVLAEISSADVVVMPLYVKVRSATGRIGLPENMTSFMEKMKELEKPTIVISFGNPYLVGEFPKARALMCAYTDAEVMVEASVEALFGEIDVRGRLPVSIPGQFVFGAGIEIPRSTLRRDDPEVAGFDPQKLRQVEMIVDSAVRDSVFPAAQVAIAKDGILVYNRSFGTSSYDESSETINNSTIFDLASLTKVIATTAAVMKLYDGGRLMLDDPVSKFISPFGMGKKAFVTIRQLLTHTSGLPPFRKLYEFCSTPEEALDSVFSTQLVASPGDSTIYSDLGMIVLGKIVEKIAGMPLDAFTNQAFYEPLGMTNTLFNPPESFASRVVPTEIDTVFRKRVVQGTVHDENADLLGGVSGHAGLFSNASDLSVFMQMLMNGGVYDGVRYLSEKTIREFTHRASPATKRGLGWDFKSEKGSSAGDLFSTLSFGHTGFTGTSIWVDPVRNMFVVFLTNRVYPTRANNSIRDVRRALHNAVVRALQDVSHFKETRRAETGIQN
jgi:beta-glucosidase-like glycosyl hydrolase/CubicO group peptidase (beta-lactamase class C family)